MLASTFTYAFGLAVGGAACTYAALAAALGVARTSSDGVRAARLPAVTILKPLCGAEPELYEQLRSFCVEANAQTQILFGVHSLQDGAVPVVRRLQREFHGRDLALVADGRVHGANRKTSNLINMIPYARHDVFVIADSDVLVPRGYLERVVAPLSDAHCGLVTCLYRGRAHSGLWSALGVLFIDEWFAPAVRVAAALGSQAFTSGATIAIRRDVLATIGGFEAIADRLADDFDLGALVRARGLRIVLADVVVDTAVAEPTFASFARHHLRWLRTIRAIQPIGYVGTVITFSVPVAILAILLTGGAAASLYLFAATVICKMVLHVRAAARTGQGRRVSWALAVVQDFVTLALWCLSFLERRITWRDQRYVVESGGTLRAVSSTREDPRC